MIQRHLRHTAGAILLALFMLTGTSALLQDNAQLRFVHAIPGAAAIDIYLDGQLAARNLNLGDSTAYISAPAAQQRITVTPTGATTVLWEQTYTPASGKAYTLVASSFDQPVEFTSFEDLLDPLPLGKARFTTIHAIADAPTVDVVLDDGRPLVLAQSYNQPFGTLDVPVFAYNLAVVPAGGAVEDAILTLDGVALNSGHSYMLLLYGTAANPQSKILSTPTRPETANSGFIRLVHAIPDAPTVDVYLGEGVLAATLTNPEGGSNTTDYIAVPAGDYAVELRPNGSTDDSVLLSTSATVNSGDYITALAQSQEGDIVLNFLTDAVSSITAGEALIRVVNATTEDLSASLASGTIVANNLAAGSASSISSIAPATDSLILSGTASGTNNLPEQDFYGGTFYDVLVFDGTAAVSSAALAQSAGSAPGASATSLATAAQPTEVLPTPVPVAQPTTAPVEPAAAQPTVAPVVLPVSDLPTGRVFNLNVDANLHLRQYPDTQALSLGTVPFGTILTVNGREGALADIFISATQIPPDYEYVDPVSLLPDDKTDLPSEETWLNVTYNTPDGGTIDAWVRADFIDIREATGEQIRLRDLDTVPGNQPGEARNTDITPPPAKQDLVTVRVINLDPGANLNVRRTPDPTGEVLAQLPLNTVAEFLGLSEAGDWVYLSYASPDGVTITGWSSTSFLQLNLNGEPTDLQTLEAKGLLVTTDLEQRGSQTVGAAPVIAPTVDPTIDAVVAEVALDPGANLNLRRNPDVTAEVLAQIPSGTRVIVAERTADALWLNVTYEGISGWIAAQTDTAIFVRLSFNGAPFDIEDVPVLTEAG